MENLSKFISEAKQKNSENQLNENLQEVNESLITDFVSSLSQNELDLFIGVTVGTLATGALAGLFELKEKLVKKLGKKADPIIAKLEKFSSGFTK